MRDEVGGSTVPEHVQTAWPDYPDYRIEITLCPHTGRVWHGDVLVAESDTCLLVTETDHADRLYFPESAVRWELFMPSPRTTVCPFKGRASYWGLEDAKVSTDAAVWTYHHPLPEVSGISGHVSFDDDLLRIEVVESWSDGSTVASTFPLWGDADDLMRLMNVEPGDGGEFTGPAHGPARRDVVEGGQLLGEAVVAVLKDNPNQRVTSASMIFTRAASFGAAVNLAVDPLRRGRTISTSEVRLTQHGKLCSVGLVLQDAGSVDVIRHHPSLPNVPEPESCEPFVAFGMTGREIRVVDGAYVADPDRVGPPTVNAWVRFRQSPADPRMQLALLAQSTTHWAIAAGLAPHRGFGEAQAHTSLSTAVLKSDIAFHDDVDVGDWLLYSNHTFWSGRGLIEGSGRVFARNGRLAAFYTVQAMARAFEQSPTALGHGRRSVM